MSLKKFTIALALGSAMVCSRGVFAAEGAKEKPAATAEGAGKDPKAAGDKPAGDKAASTVKLTKPWSDLTTLTDDQKSKIEVIHKKALAETSAIDKKAKEDIMAVLTDAQKAELKDLTSKKKKETTAAKKPEATEKKTEKGEAPAK